MKFIPKYFKDVWSGNTPVATLIKDGLIFAAIAFAIWKIGYHHFLNSESVILSKSVEFIGNFTILAFGILGFFGFAYDNGLLFLVPSTYIEHKSSKSIEHTKMYLDEFFIRESNYFSLHENQRIEYFLNQIGLKKDQFEKIKLEILKIKLMPLVSCDDAKRKIVHVLKHDKVILTTREFPPSDRVYREVDYYINFSDIMHSDDYQKEVTDCFSFFIKENLKDELSRINRIVVPHSSNFLLGVSLSKKLSIPFVKVNREPKILINKPWEGVFNTVGDNNVIIIHDVLISGTQIVESIEKIPSGCSIKAIFCLVNRIDCVKDSRLNSNEIPIYSLLNLSSTDIEEIVSAR